MEAGLQSKDKECAMVFVVEVTASKGMKYDRSYDKCFIPSKNNLIDSRVQIKLR